MESHLPCASGIPGAGLAARIRNIVTAGVRQLGTGKKLLLAAIGIGSFAVPLAVGLAYPVEMRAQAAAQTVPPLRFDVASVKMAADQNLLQTRPNRTVGRFRWTTQLAYLVQYAYHMEPWRISGDMSSFGFIYEIEATTDPNTTEEQTRLMLQSLLIDRFKMSVHRVSKEAVGYALTVAKDGPRMQEATERDAPPLPEWMRKPSSDPAKLDDLVVATMPQRGVTAIVGRRVTMRQLIETLQRMMGTAVLDQTGLDGKYYFGFRYANGDDLDVPFPDLFITIKDLGLRLEKHKGPVEMLVVDHIEKTPTEN